MVKIAINGFGRIGRNILRAFHERPELHGELQIVAINDLGSPEMNAHLLRYDTVHGRFAKDVAVEGDALRLGDDTVSVYAERDPSALPWRDQGVDIVLECTGRFTTRDTASQHLHAGAGKVLISAPAKHVDATIVYGVNHQTLSNAHRVVSNASCTTNCLAPIVKPLNDAVGIRSGLMTTIHAYTNDQHLSDVYHEDPFRARAAAHSMIPTRTGAAAAIGLVLPELSGRLDGLAVRVPTLNVSLVDLTFLPSRETSIEEVNAIMRQACSEDRFGVLSCNDQPLVSVDFNHNPCSSNFDLNHNRVSEGLVKVLSWYDNEWGFSNRMLDTALAMAKA